MTTNDISSAAVEMTSSSHPVSDKDHCRIVPAVIFLPGRSRKRFSAGCVQVVPNCDEARQREDAKKHLFSATVMGPSKSSEGQSLFYLVEWLGSGPDKF